MMFTKEQSAELMQRINKYENELLSIYGTPIHLKVQNVQEGAFNIETIIEKACAANGVSVDDMKKNARTSYYIDSVRQSICILAKMYSSLHNNAIAEAINRERTSVFQNITAARRLMDAKDEMFMAVFNRSHNSLVSND